LVVEPDVDDRMIDIGGQRRRVDVRGALVLQGVIFDRDLVSAGRGRSLVVWPFGTDVASVDDRVGFDGCPGGVADRLINAWRNAVPAIMDPGTAHRPGSTVTISRNLEAAERGAPAANSRSIMRL
jgi:hypothetical protein